MTNTAVVVPIAVLASIVAVSLVFVWWWFPRTWAKGNAEERAIIDAERMERERYMANFRAEQARKRAEEGNTGEGASELTDLKVAEEGKAIEAGGIGTKEIKRPARYVPPVTPF